jgi:hypothetical protein
MTSTPSDTTPKPFALDERSSDRIYAADQAAKTLAAETGLDLRVERSTRWAIWTVVCRNAGIRFLAETPHAVTTCNVIYSDDLGTVDGLRAELRHALLRPGVEPAAVEHPDRTATTAAESEQLIRRFLGQPATQPAAA